jgi:hypothetical protein
MNKPNCNITRKFLKREKAAAEKIKRFINARHSRRKQPTLRITIEDVTPPPPEIAKRVDEAKIKEFTNKVHTRRLQRFMQKVDPHSLRSKVRAKYLDGVCSDSGVCIAFGNHVEKIK